MQLSPTSVGSFFNFQQVHCFYFLVHTHNWTPFLSDPMGFVEENKMNYFDLTQTAHMGDVYQTQKREEIGGR